jgi:hypothetical protein
MTTVIQAGFLAPMDFGTAASAATFTTPVMATPPIPSTDLEKILAAIGGLNASIGGINTRFDTHTADFNACFDGVTARFDTLGDRIQAFESLGSRINALDEHVRTTNERITTTDGVLSDMDKRITTTADLITATTTRLDEQIKGVDVVATDKLIEYGRKLVDYGSRLGHVTSTELPKIQSALDAFATRVTNIESRPPNTTTQDVRHGDASSHASVADDDSDHNPPHSVDDVRFSAPGHPPNIGDEHLSPTARAHMAWAALHNSRATDRQPLDATHVQPPSYRDNRPNPIQRPDLPVDARDPPYDLSSVGPLESPRLGDHEHRARQLGVSRFDILGLAHTTYHAGADGFPTLTPGVLGKIGYNKISSGDVVSCHNDIIAVHRRILEIWHNPVSHAIGPQIDRIITKSLKLLPSLASPTTENVVDFYDRLQESTTGLVIALMPFDAIMLTNRFEGLCVPALGIRRYQLMSWALTELLPRLIPGTLTPQINAALSSVRYESNNGYDYLWRVLELTVPGFDPVVPIQIPSWSNADDVFSFAQSYLLYFRLQSKHNFHYDDRTRSSIFLRAIQFSDFADTVTTLQSHVNSFREPFDDGYLPPHLRLHGLATSIDQNTQARMRAVISPRVRRLHTIVQGLPTVHRVDRDDRSRAGFKDRDGGGKFDRDYRTRGRPDTTRTPRERQRAPANPGRLARPDRNRRPFLPDVQCAACKRVGHVAKHCDMLATAICLERYMKRDMSDSVQDAIEKDWLTHWKDRLDNPDRTPRQVLRAYVEELDITVAGLDEAMEWECWVDDTPSDDSDDSDERLVYGPDRCVGPDPTTSSLKSSTSPPLPSPPPTTTPSSFALPLRAFVRSRQ